MMALSIGVVAGLLQVVGYVIYAHATFRGRLKPNAASWALWAIGALIESGSYIAATDGIAKHLLPLLCALCAIIFFILAWHFGHFEKLTKLEFFIIFLDLVAIFIWWHYESAIYANIYIVLTAFLSFIPIILHAWNDPKHENATPWLVWSIAYTLLGIVVAIEYTSWQELFFPVVYTFLCLVVAILAIDRRIPGKLRFRPIA